MLKLLREYITKILQYPEVYDDPIFNVLVLGVVFLCVITAISLLLFAVGSIINDFVWLMVQGV